MGGHFMKALLVFALCLLGSGNAYAVNCAAADEHRMLCRGKLGVEYYGNVRAVDRSFLWIRPSTHMATGAGQKGEFLIQGTCAFADRPVRANEPDRIRFFISNHSAYTVVNMVTQCLGDRECALEFCVRNIRTDVGQIFAAGENAVQLNYPSFRH